MASQLCSAIPQNFYRRYLVCYPRRLYLRLHSCSCMEFVFWDTKIQSQEKLHWPDWMAWMSQAETTPIPALINFSFVASETSGLLADEG